MKPILVSLLLISACITSAFAQEQAALYRPQVAIMTSKGEIVVELKPEKAPKTVENFLECKQGIDPARQEDHPDHQHQPDQRRRDPGGHGHHRRVKRQRTCPGRGATLGREVHELIDLDGLGDALERLTADGPEAKCRLVKRAVDARRDADAAGPGDGLDARGDVERIAEDHD